MTHKVELLDVGDIFDFYGCQYLYNSAMVSKDDRKKMGDRIKEIHAMYVEAVRERIKAEMKFLGIKVDTNSISGLLKAIEEFTYGEMEKQSVAMMSGEGFNMMGMIIEANRMAGRDVSDVEGMFGTKKKKAERKPKQTIDSDSLVKDPKWHVIAKAFEELESAMSVDRMIFTIDALNDLQHNSFHLLIDLQTGRMLESSSEGGMKNHHGEAVNVVKEVLGIKQKAKSPIEFSDKMSEDVREMIHSYRF